MVITYDKGIESSLLIDKGRSSSLKKIRILCNYFLMKFPLAIKKKPNDKGRFLSVVNSPFFVHYCLSGFTLGGANSVIFMVRQVAVALSHAAILEESMRARDLLVEQNIALDFARRQAEMAIRARNDFLAVMNHEMRTPMHAIIALSSLLQETELTPEQRLMVETILKSSNLLATLINDVLELSRLEDGSLKLDLGTFNLHALFREVGLYPMRVLIGKLHFGIKYYIAVDSAFRVIFML